MYTKELEVASRLAREAATIIRQVYETPFSVVQKSGGGGPVTEADQRANELIVKGLQQAFPADDIVAEESTHRAPKTQRVWFVDPLDGTREFVDRNGMFAVHIGLAIDGAPVAGVVLAPMQGALWTGAVGQPCVLELGEQRRELTMQPVAQTKDLRLLVSRSHKSKKTAAIRDALGITQVKEQGSVGLKCALLAMGEADLYLHPSDRSSRWDSCAPQAVIEAAGGMLVDFAGKKYGYEGREIVNSRGLVACARSTWPMIAETVIRVATETGILK
ncbi:MAG: 3'(2'),5'-bisphosphate nucleotidase CysQ [Archangium sp.]|nr:3'(2'),5'-bisphosphate nucleotidase CysQ [Archangium sp.]